MSYGYIARFNVIAQSEAEFVRAAQTMEKLALDQAQVLLFRFFRIAGDNRFAVVENFVDEAASVAFDESEQARPLVAAMTRCIAGGYTREMLQDL